MEDRGLCTMEEKTTDTQQITQPPYRPRDARIVSYNMSRIRSHGTTIERRLARAMWAAGLRYRKQYPVVGRPDFAFPRAKIAIFCDSEFWHGYGWNEERKSEFKTNRDFWIAKIEKNIDRDKEVNEELTGQGWLVLRFSGREIRRDLESCLCTIRRQLTNRS